jgi:hypothetical protein
MKLHVIAPLATAADGFAPIAAAAPTAPTIATDATVQQNRGNAKITTHPGAPADSRRPPATAFGADMLALIFHHLQ